MSSPPSRLSFAAASLLLCMMVTAQPTLAGPPVPFPIIDLCQCRSNVFDRDASGGVITRDLVVAVTGQVDPNGAPRDTCPIGGQLHVEWHGEPSGVTGWRYRLDDPEFVTVPGGRRSVTYDRLRFDPTFPDTFIGPRDGKTFTLQALGPRSSVRETSRGFILNFFPDTWWSGPDPTSPSLLTKPNGEKYVMLVNGLPPPIAGSLLSADSTLILPALRAERRTFLEIWDDTVFVRQEGDTVHMGSWLLFHGGGLDRDSEYRVKVSPLADQLPGFPGGPVLQPGPAIGSPIGFRSQMVVALTPNGRPSITGVSNLYPIFDPNSVFHLPRIGGYHPAFQAGRAFAVLYGVDGDGSQDRRIPDPRALVLRIENGTATPEETALRSKVVTFEVDRAPFLVTSSPLFRPRPMEVFTTSQWNLRLVAHDEDPFSVFYGPIGGPSPFLTLRRKIKVIGTDLQGNPLVYVQPEYWLNGEAIALDVPSTLAPGPCIIEVELCDCDACEDFVGSGRRVVQQFAVFYQPTADQTAARLQQPGVPEGVGNQVGARTPVFHLASYPNPARSGATFRFQLPTAGAAELELFDLAGQRVIRLASVYLPAGEHSRTWDGEDEAGRPVAAGLYMVRLRLGEATLTRKVVAP